MKISRAARELLKGLEGLATTPYLCSGGKPTIGYGHVIIPGEIFQRFDEDAADELLSRDLVRFEAGVEKLCADVKLAQHEFDALVLFAFNIGLPALRQSTLLKKLRRGDREGAAAQFARWVYAKGVKLPGLEKRRALEEAFFRGER